MELFREEYQKRLGPNWGKITFDRMLARELAEKATNHIPKKISNNVKKALKSDAFQTESEDETYTESFDGSNLLDKMSEDELCTLFSQSSLSIRKLILREWNSISMKVLRCISIKLSDTILEIDFSNSSTTSAHLEVVLPRTIYLKTLILSNCRLLDVKALNTITKLTNNSLNELYINKCPCIKEEALCWIGGTVGFNQPKLRKLVLLDISETNATDNGLIAIASGCKKLQYLNLKECISISDKGMQTIAQSCPRLKLLNLTNCGQVTNKSLIAIGQNCHELVSIAIARLIQIDDRGLIALALGCKYLQSVNIACCLKITERSICVLVENCKGILVLNVSGCPEVTSNGINALIRGLKYVEAAISYIGFKPIDKHTEKKLSDQIDMIKGQEQYRIESREQYLKQLQQTEKAERIALEDKCARIIQRQIHMYYCRMRYYRMWQRRLKGTYAVVIQRVYRGILGRKKANEKRAIINSFKILSPHATMIQKNMRGFICRKRRPDITKVLYELYKNRKEEAYAGLLVLVQANARRHLAKVKLNAWKEINIRRSIDEYNAAVLMQTCARGYLARQQMNRTRHTVMRYQRVRRSAANHIKQWYKNQRLRIQLKEESKHLFELLQRMKISALFVQRVYRGHLGRCIYHRILIDTAVQHKAAIMIQSIYRGSKVLHWKDIKMNMIAAYVLDRHYVDRKNTIYQTRLRYQQFIHENRGDSGSEPDEDLEEIEWVRAYDEIRKKEYWYNNVNTDIVFEEPRLNYAHEKSIIGLRVKIYWIVQKAWYEGQITRFQPKTNRHRIQYDDGDREWINLEKEHERVQIQSEDGSWMLYQLYESPALLNELRKIKDKRTKEDYKKQAFTDALQWKAIQDDNTNHLDVMFISLTTGEIRKGVPGALDWIVQDDGYGFPCFYNMITQSVEHEDPRFIIDEDEDLASQRRYVMQELRYALYFCTEYWDQFSQALNSGDSNTQQLLCLKVCKSLKPKHLSSFLIRAQVLYKRTSVVDKPIHQDIEKELEYAAFISARMTDMSQRGEEIKRIRKEHKKRVIESLDQSNPQQILFCPTCHLETKRHLDLCPHCGKRQIF